jgi:PAS domain S-box-containing protein
VESFLVGLTRFLSVSDNLALIVGLQGELGVGDGSFQIGLNQLNLKRVLLLCRLEFGGHRRGILAHRAERRLLQERSEAVAASSEYAKDTIVFGYLSAFFFLLGAGWVVYEEMRRRKLAEEGLRNSKEHLNLLISSVTDYAIFMLDPQGHVISWNAGAHRIKGYSAMEILGQHFSRFYSAEDIERGKPDLELKIAAEQGRIEYEGWRVCNDGSRFWAHVIITALRDEAGNLRGFGKVTRDTTQANPNEKDLIRQGRVGRH